MPFGWVAAGVAVAGTIYGAAKQQEALNTQADEARLAGSNAQYQGMLQEKLNDMQADEVMRATNDQVAQIRKTAAQMRGSLVSAQAGSGVVIGEGSAQAAVDQIETLAAADALAALYAGVNKVVSIKTDGRWAADAGENQYKSSLRQATSLNIAGDTAMITGITSAIGQAGGAYAKAQTPSGGSNINTTKG